MDQRLDGSSNLREAMAMGNREALLVGAKQCLYEKGYARTTARDIATASGVSLAAIGYHYGSVEALLNAAMIQAIEEWGEEIGRALAADVQAAPDAPPLERFAAIWTRVIESFETHRPLFVATFEATAQVGRALEVRQFLAGALQQGREGLAMLFGGIDAGTDPHTAQIVGSFYQALMSGIGIQWITDPERAPSGRDLAEALRIVTGTVEER
jgi:AcrR family transcriptional regulator